MPGAVNVYVEGSWTVVRYLVFPFALVFVLAAGLSVAINKLSRERVLNRGCGAPWRWPASPC